MGTGAGFLLVPGLLLCPGWHHFRALADVCGSPDHGGIHYRAFPEIEHAASEHRLYAYHPLLCSLALSFLHFFVFKGGSYDYLLLLGFFLLVWANDSGAYLIGVRFGKHRLFPRISPRKSWEGAVGGFVFTLVIAFVLSLFIEQLSWGHWLVIGVLVSVMGTFGDLVESMLKRSVNVKDSGSRLSDSYKVHVLIFVLIACYDHSQRRISHPGCFAFGAGGN